MRIGPVNRKAIDLSQHPIGEDAVQIERDDDRLVAGERTRLLEQVALGVKLAIRAHCAMQREIDGVGLIDLRPNPIHDLG